MRWEVEGGDADEKLRDVRRALRMQQLEDHKWHLEGLQALHPMNDQLAKYWIQHRFSASHRLVSVVDGVHLVHRTR